MKLVIKRATALGRQQWQQRQQRDSGGASSPFQAAIDFFKLDVDRRHAAPAPETTGGYAADPASKPGMHGPDPLPKWG